MTTLIRFEYAIFSNDPCALKTWTYLCSGLYFCIVIVCLSLSDPLIEYRYKKAPLFKLLSKSKPVSHFFIFP